MSARAAGVTLALLVLAAQARAAVIEGRVTHPSKPGASAHLTVEVIGLDPQEHGIQRRTETDATGHYKLDDLPAPAAYLIRAYYGGLAFPGGSAAFPPGQEKRTETLDFHVFDPSSDASRLKLSSLQWVIERQAGVWHVAESATVTNPDPVVVVIPAGAPTPIRLGLAPGHGKVLSMFGRPPEGIAVDGDVAEVRGPVFPGDAGFSVQMEYDLDQAPAALATQIRVPSAVDDVGVYVQDFGIDVDAGELLHPARHVVENDLIYQAFLGFDLPAGTDLPLAVRALPPAQPLPRPWVAFLAALGAGALLFFVAQPIVREALARDAPAEPAEESPAKAALAAALRDLEHDFETGKLSAEDRERMHADLRREAVAALARERLGPAQPAAVPPPLEPCTCGRMPAAGDRFCAGCGKPL
jgi:hypothetical protein